ncbi:MAG: SPFH domain-containing protein [Ruminococcus sp.]|nr:SPFH domain-containing protein [Ruminococcus sp.]
MGIIRAAINAVTGGLADTWLEVIEPSPMGEHTVFAPGQLVSQNGKSQNKKGSSNIVSNGSIIHVYDKQMMILVDGGKIVDYTAEPGYFKVDNSSMPSLFNGQFGDSIKESFSRIKYGGVSSQSQHVFYINLKEIKNIKFGTSSPVQYYDMFYEAELFMRLHGSYSIEITDPFKFYQQVVPNENVTQNRALEFEGEFLKQYNEEFVMELGTAFNQYSADGNRISFITSKSKEMAKYLRDALDDEWREERGFEVKAVAMGMPKYSDKSQEIIDKRAEMGASVSFLRDGANQQAYMAKNIAEGINAAGHNEGGAMNAFLGMGMAQNMGGNVLGGYMQNPQYVQSNPQQGMQQQQMQQQAPQQAPQPAPAGSWTCSCGAVNSGKFCSECGSPKPAAPKKRFCGNCGAQLTEGQKFCPECGTKQ